MTPAQAGCRLFPKGGKCKYIAPLHPRPSVHGKESHPMASVSVCTEHSRSTEVHLEKQFLSYGVSAMPM